MFMQNNNDNDNAKNPDWKLPVKLPGVKPEDYPTSIDSGNGSAEDKTPLKKPNG